MHNVIFYPVGNGDTGQIILANGKRLLFDFHHQSQGEDDSHPVMNIKKRLRDELKIAKRDYYDVVAFTHADKDHIAGFSEFFELEQADKYKGNGRIKIRELWVPAAVLLEQANNDQQSDEYVLLRQEARKRLRDGKGIQIFSKPEALKDWMEQNDISFEDRKGLFTDAGTLARGFTLEADNVEFFCHSPFMKHCDEGDILRNDASLIFQIRFEVNGYRTDYFAVGDSKWDVLEEIVSITKFHKRLDRLQWNLLNVPHHCSYLALSDDKGDKETEPKDGIKELLREGQKDAYIVSSSNPIPDTVDMYKSIQPPHIQARKAYERYLREVSGRKFYVTMEEPNASKPQPLEFEISERGLRFLGRTITGAAAVISSTPPRAG
jgi:hypothetical protein